MTFLEHPLLLCVHIWQPEINIYYSSCHEQTHLSLALAFSSINTFNGFGVLTCMRAVIPDLSVRKFTSVLI